MFLLSYVLNGFFKQTLKLFFFLLIDQTLVLERLFFLEYHIFEYLTMGNYYQNNVDRNIVLFGCSCRCIFLKHGLNYVHMRAIINFMFNGIIDEVVVNDGTKFVHFFVTSFVTGFYFLYHQVVPKFHSLLHFFILKFVVWVV
jgi:hypothetical protein